MHNMCLVRFVLLLDSTCIFYRFLGANKNDNNMMVILSISPFSPAFQLPKCNKCYIKCYL